MNNTKKSNWLLNIGAGLIGLHLILSYHAGSSDLFTLSLLFWITLSYLIWQKRDRLKWETDLLSSVLGTIIIALMLYKSWNVFEDDFFLRLSPLLLFSGWGLLASGFRKFEQFWREVLLLGFLSIPWEFVYLFDISLVTAKFSTFLLWVVGFDVTRQGVWVMLSTGSVEVYNGCSGVRMMAQLLGLSWIILAIAPTKIWQKIGLPVIALLLGFCINGIRVALMTILVALSDIEGFKYWHVGDGSLIFSAIAVLIFGGICMTVLAPKQECNR